MQMASAQQSRQDCEVPMTGQMALTQEALKCHTTRSEVQSRKQLTCIKNYIESTVTVTVLVTIAVPVLVHVADADYWFLV